MLLLIYVYIPDLFPEADHEKKASDRFPKRLYASPMPSGCNLRPRTVTNTTQNPNKKAACKSI
jgi:hypothetical protein